MISYIESPLQLICAIEYDQKFDKINTFYIRKSTIQTNDQLSFLVCKYSALRLNFIFLPPLNILNTHSWIYFILTNFYKKVLIGNENSFVSIFFYKKIITDDGTKTISILNRKNKINNEYRTFFNIGNFKNNSFNFFKKYFKTDSLEVTNVVYFFGQKLIEVGLIDKYSYISLLKMIKNNFKEYELYYFKHRGESDQNLNEIRNLGFVIKSLNYPVEFYPIEVKSKPKYVISFFSTALLTYSEIYNTNFLYYKLDNLILKSCEEFNYIEIYKYLSQHGEEIHL